eukprot:CAMPEP_0118706534 /NCGR_PEP_ID=MMETSP0800-20121206/20615_1 /TAXON_ID=210618 ORGANISM="Striatella unipunctata, Strain CCMP2910" /NCGR_SAMPLE_ID=MMETSP0800 /ASSEMBLY_ACC=CAM_ASM_000638 /LENGTH=121 /DNA_ID=CAMNT_0006609087 /DNA_START=187 /DNA_END=552 /DNA_ORIENTATION=+
MDIPNGFVFQPNQYLVFLVVLGVSTLDKKKYNIHKRRVAKYLERQYDSTTTRENNKNNNKTKQHRKQVQKEKRAQIPCKFYLSPGGCWRGDKCMFLHQHDDDDKIVANNNDDDEPEPMSLS